MNCYQDYLLREVWIQQGEQSELDAEAFAAFEIKLKKKKNWKSWIWAVKTVYRCLKFVTHYQLNHQKE